MNKLLLGRKINDEEVCRNDENKEKDNEKGSLKYESEIVNKVKTELKLNVDEQQDAIKHLKEYCDIDDIEPPWKDNAVYKKCNQSMPWKNG